MCLSYLLHLMKNLSDHPQSAVFEEKIEEKKKRKRVKKKKEEGLYALEVSFCFTNTHQ